MMAAGGGRREQTREQPAVAEERRREASEHACMLQLAVYAYAYTAASSICIAALKEEERVIDADYTAESSIVKEMKAGSNACGIHA